MITREVAWKLYDIVMKSLEKHEIEARPENGHTTFYFHGCCGGDIVSDIMRELG